MVHLRSISLVVGLLLSLAAFRDSIALEDGGMVTFQHNDAILKSDQALQENTKMVDATGSVELRGRRMGKEKVMEVKGSVKTGANHSQGRCGHGGEVESRCKLGGRRIPKRFHFVGLIPFSSDYRRPVNHPPKNN